MADTAAPKSSTRKTTAPSATSRSATAARKAAATRKVNATKRSTTAKKAAQTRAAKRGSATRSRNAVKSPVARVGGLAEKAVLVPVGVTLVTRERLLAAIDETRATYSTRKKAENEIGRYERRAASALRSIERDMSRTRDRVGSELRSGRTRVEKEVRALIEDIETRTSPVVNNVNVVGARVENVVQSGRSAATRASATVQERLGVRA